MVAVYQKNEIRAIATQSAADTTKVLTIPLPTLGPLQAIKITHIEWVVDVSGVALWADGNRYLLAILVDPIRNINSFGIASQKGATAAGGSADVNCTGTWDDQDGFFTAQNHLTLSLFSGGTGQVNVIEAFIYFDVVTITEVNKNLLLFGVPPVVVQ